MTKESFLVELADRIAQELEKPERKKGDVVDADLTFTKPELIRLQDELNKHQNNGYVIIMPGKYHNSDTYPLQVRRVI